MATTLIILGLFITAMCLTLAFLFIRFVWRVTFGKDTGRRRSSGRSSGGFDFFDGFDGD